VVEERQAGRAPELGRRNGLIVGIGIALYLIGFLVLDAVRENHEGFLAFLAPFTILAGMIAVVVGLLAPGTKGG
jgi:multisubunit Na+/H+ antiporter MnhB subunit